MTDIHLLSDTELNEAIAKKKGWTKKNVEPAPFITTWHHENGDIELYCPDFTHDRGLAMELLEEMPTPMLKRSVEGDWICGNFNLQHGDTPQRAIAEAWLKWKGK